MRLTGIYQVLATQDLAASRVFYERYFRLRAAFVADWYVQLLDAELPLLQLGLIAAGHWSMPRTEQRANASAIVTMQVDDVDGVFDDMRKSGVQLIGDVRNERWGQRHFMAVDPSGFFIDVVMPVPPADEYAGAYAKTPA